LNLGPAVHTGAGIGALAALVKYSCQGFRPPLVVDSGIDFAGRGEHEIREVPDRWRIFEVLGQVRSGVSV
jgi:hypothetical protein